MVKTKLSDVFKLLQKILTITGFWPKPDATLSYRITGYLSLLMSLIFNILGIAGIYTEFKGIESISHAFFLNFAVALYLPKGALFLFNKKAFHAVLDNLNADVLQTYDDDLNNIIDNKIKRFKTIQFCFHSLCCMNLCSTGLVPISSGHFEKVLPVPFPFDMRQYSIYFYMFCWLLQIFTLNLTALNNNSLDMLSWSLMGIASAQLHVLRNKIERLSNFIDIEETNAEYMQERKEILRSKVKNIVEHHAAIEKLVQSVASTFTFMFLFQFGSSLSVICITEFTFLIIPVTTVQFQLSLFFYICVIVQLALYCHFGNDIMLQSLTICDACYMSGWHNYHDPAVRKSLFIIMERAKRPYILTAGKFITLTLRAFLTVMQSAFSYFTVLNQMYKKNKEK